MECPVPSRSLSSESLYSSKSLGLDTLNPVKFDLSQEQTIQCVTLGTQAFVLAGKLQFVRK